MKGKILLTGSTGFIGRAVLERLRRLTDRPMRLLRHNSVPDVSPAPQIEAVTADLARPETLAGICDGVETVLHLAVHIGNDAECCDIVNGRGTEALVEQARSAGASRFLYLSSAAVYGYAVHRNAKETDVAVRPVTPISRSRARGERAVLANGGTVLRPLFVYGHGDVNFLPAVLRAVNRLGFLIDKGRARLSVISVDDLADVLVALATGPWDEKQRGVFHINDGHPVSFLEIVDSLARCLGTRRPSLSLPYFIARHLVLFSGGSIFQKAGRRSSAHRLFLVSRDHFYDASRIWDLVSARPGAPLPERLSEYVAWYRRFVQEERIRGKA